MGFPQGVCAIHRALQRETDPKESPLHMGNPLCESSLSARIIQGLTMHPVPFTDRVFFLHQPCSPSTPVRWMHPLDRSVGTTVGINGACMHLRFMHRYTLLLLLGFQCFHAWTQLPEEGVETAARSGMHSVALDAAGMIGNPALLPRRPSSLALGMGNRYGIRAWSCLQSGALWTRERGGIGLGGTYWNTGDWRQLSLRILAAHAWNHRSSFGLGAGMRQWWTGYDLRRNFACILGAHMRTSDDWQHLILLQLDLGSDRLPLKSSSFCYGAICPLREDVACQAEIGIANMRPTARLAIKVHRPPWGLLLAAALNEHPLSIGLDWNGNRFRLCTAIQWHSVLDASPLLSGTYAY